MNYIWQMLYWTKIRWTVLSILKFKRLPKSTSEILLTISIIIFVLRDYWLNKKWFFEEMLFLLRFIVLILIFIKL